MGHRVFYSNRILRDSVELIIEMNILEINLLRGQNQLIHGF